MLSAIGNVSSHGWAPPRTEGPPQMQEVAKLLGLTGSELSSQLQSGKTLNSLASEKGVSGNELIKTIETELSTHKPEGAPALEPSQLTQMATSIANGTPPTGVGHIGHASSTQSESSTLAQTLGVEPSELLAQLEEGLDPTSLAPSTGYTSDGSVRGKPRAAGSRSTASPSVSRTAAAGGGGGARRQVLAAARSPTRRGHTCPRIALGCAAPRALSGPVEGLAAVEALRRLVGEDLVPARGDATA